MWSLAVRAPLPPHTHTHTHPHTHATYTRHTRHTHSHTHTHTHTHTRARTQSLVTLVALSLPCSLSLSLSHCLSPAILSFIIITPNSRHHICALSRPGKLIENHHCSAPAKSANSFLWALGHGGKSFVRTLVSPLYLLFQGSGCAGVCCRSSSLVRPGLESQVKQAEQTGSDDLRGEGNYPSSGWEVNMYQLCMFGKMRVAMQISSL